MDGMEKRALLAVFISILILFAWQSVFLKKTKLQPPVKQAVVETQKQQPQSVPESSGTFQYESKTPSDVRKEELVVIETELYRASFSTRGAALKSFKLKKYKDKVGKSGQWIEMMTQTDPRFYSLGLFFSDQNFQEFQDVDYSVEKENGREILFSHRSNGIKIERHYVFDPQKYSFMHTTRVWPKDHKPKGDVLFSVSEGFSQVHTGNILTAPYQDVRNFVYAHQEKTEREKVSDLESDKKINLVTHWLGIENRYFLSALVNEGQLKPYTAISKPLPGMGMVSLQYPFYLDRGQDFFEVKIQGYVGPKKMELLKEANEKLAEAVDFGIFSFFCIPLLAVMNFFYSLINNYGIAILLLTVLIRILFHPLTKKSLVSMREMQKIQPQMAQIKEKYKDDKQKLNQEIMDLMRTNKVNPLGGCLPLLFQMPIFFALYRVLYNAIELYQAPFFGWILDLSAKDPYYVMPLLMGVAMFAQQKLTPTAAADPMQQKMMMMMPVIFTFFMIPLPSGLVLYIFISTLLQVLSQYWVNRDLAKKEA